MCEFVSYVRKEGVKKGKDVVLFLTNDDFRSTRGKQLTKYMSSSDPIDLNGHGALRAFFGLGKVGDELLQGGLDREVTDFSSPKNFPYEIAKAIKLGRMSEMGMPHPDYFSDMLIASAVEKLGLQDVVGCETISKLPTKIRKEVNAKISRIVENEEAEFAVCSWDINEPSKSVYVSKPLRTFVWEDTKEGFDYWDKINILLEGYKYDDDDFDGRDEEFRKLFWKLFSVKSNRTKSQA
jgi:hypothetical protein